MFDSSVDSSRRKAGAIFFEKKSSKICTNQKNVVTLHSQKGGIAQLVKIGRASCRERVCQYV